jgi:hypothetical protein
LGLTFAAFVAIHIASPWQYRNDDNGAWFTSVARAHRIAGIGATRAQDHFVSRDSDALIPYLHHPPFVGLYLAAVFGAVGHDSPLVARVAILALHGLTVILILAIARVAMPTRAHLRSWSLLILALTPMSVFYGKMPNHEAPALCFVLVGIYAHQRWIREGTARKRWAILTAVGWTLAAFTAWHAILMTLGYLLLFPRVRMADPRVSTMAAWTIVCAAAALVVAHLLWAGDWQLHSSQRDSLATWLVGAVRPASFVRSIARAYERSALFFGCVPWVLATGWLVALCAVRRRRPFRPAERTVLALGAGTAVYTALFAEAVRVHPYQHFYLLPFVAMTSGLALRRGAAWLRRRGGCSRHLVFACVALTVIASGAQLIKLYRKPYRPAVEATWSIQTQYR